MIKEKNDEPWLKVLTGKVVETGERVSVVWFAKEKKYISTLSSENEPVSYNENEINIEP